MTMNLSERSRYRTNGSDAGARHGLVQVGAAEFCYYLAFGLYALSCFFNGTTFESVMGLPLETFSDGVHLVVLALLLFKFISQRAPLRGWLFAIAVVLVGFVSWRASDQGFLFWLALFVVCSENVNVRVLAAISLGVIASMVAVTVLCALGGVIDNRVSVRDGEVRYAMGFLHPNNFGAQILMICTSIAVLRFGKNPLPILPVLLLAFLVNYFVANSRTCAYLCALLAVLVYTLYLAKERTARRRLSIAFAVIVTAVILASLYFMVAYDASNPAHVAFDQLLSGRFRWAHAYYVLQPLTLFGSSFEDFAPIYWDNGIPSTFVVDNAYAHLVLRFGIIPSCIFLCGYLALLFSLIRQQRWDVVLFGVVLMAIYGFTEVAGIQVECNYFLTAMGTELLFNGSGLLKSTNSPDRPFKAAAYE